MVQPKRRLPLLNAGGASADEVPARSPWQWVGFGALAIFAVWVPLAWLSMLVAIRVSPGETSARVLATRALVLAAGLAVSALAGGYLIGKWGTAGVGVREAALAGLVAALVATALAWATVGVSAAALATVAIAVPPAALGGYLGSRRRV